MSTLKKKGPKGPYAIKKLMNGMSDDRKQELRRKFYIERMTRIEFAKEVGIGRSLVNEFIQTLGPPVITNNDDESE